MPFATVLVVPDRESEELEVATPAPKMPRALSFRPASSRLQAAILLGLLTLLAIAIDGYHPYGEDAGIYIAGIKQLIHPSMFGTSADFIKPYFRFSFFSLGSDLILRTSHLSLDTFLLLMQIATTGLLLAGCWALACRIFRSSEARWAATTLVAICLSVPVAGSALSLMDPYLTGRSLSTPLTLLAVCACLDRKPIRVAFLLALTAMCHPLMAIYSAEFLLVVWASMRRSWPGLACIVAFAFATAGVIEYSQRSIVESAAYRTAVATRSYYFLACWRWYELVGIAAPLAILAFYCWMYRNVRSDTTANSENVTAIILAQACLAVGLLSVAISLTFARPSNASHLIAALQTIRPFVTIYFCMFLLLGGLVGSYLSRRIVWRWAAFFLVLSAGLSFSQHRAYPASPHLELPWITNANSWNRAFLWIRAKTPPDSIVALDADYINAPGEDSQGFRAIAERASLADRSKDGGAAAAFPQLADRWLREQSATTGLNVIDDAERRRRLLPFSVAWVILDGHASTYLRCPFSTDSVKVCQFR